MEYNPLVSILVVTYNSSKYIIDALESVKNQTYQNVELVVSDDCSKDETVDVCRKWMDENKSRFVNVELVTTEKNTGTSANANRGLQKCKGEWVKFCAGDDALFSDCVEKLVQFVTNNPEARAITGKLKEYRFSFDEENVVVGHMSRYNDNKEILDKSAEEQLKKLVYGNSFIPPTGFFCMQVVREVGGFDEKYGILEDFPFYLQLLMHGYKFYRIDEFVAKYRTSDTNVFGRMDVLFNYKHRYYDYLVRRDMCFSYYSTREKIRTHTSFASCWIMNKLGLQKRTLFNTSVFAAIHLIFAVLTLDFGQLWSYFRSAVRKVVRIR